MSIKKSDKVSWTGHGRGGSVTHSGVVEVVVPAGKLPSAEHLKAVSKTGAQPRKSESYVIHVSAGPDSRSKGKLYWPNTSFIKAL